MWMGCGVFFNWSTVFICAPGFPARAARRRYGALWWAEGELTTVRSAKDEKCFYDFLNYFAG
jgi:hypothetical protein